MRVASGRTGARAPSPPWAIAAERPHCPIDRDRPLSARRDDSPAGLPDQTDQELTYHSWLQFVGDVKACQSLRPLKAVDNVVTREAEAEHGARGAKPRHQSAIRCHERAQDGKGCPVLSEVVG